MCTTFCFKERNNLYVGKNLDMFTDLGYVFTNQRDMKKTALLMPPEEPLTWISEYGSITFNQAGKESPNGGMNEKGLVVEQMTLPETRYPELDTRKSISDLQWIQYILDTCETVEDVLKIGEAIRISFTSASKLHYFIVDKYGTIAIIEHIDGQMITYSGDNLPVSVLSNSNYKDCLKYCNNKGLEYDPNDYYLINSLERFERAAKLMKIASNKSMPSIEYGFQVLKEIKREDTTWSIVYDIKNLCVYFHTLHHPKIKTITSGEIDFSNKKPALVSDMNIEGIGNINNRLEEYSTAVNRELIYSLYRNEIFMKALGVKLSDEVLDYLASYPEQIEKVRR